MKISIRLDDSKLVGIDIYEISDDSLEATLQAILGNYTPVFTSRGSSSAAVAVGASELEPSVSIREFNPRPESESEPEVASFPSLEGMSDESWSEHLCTLWDAGDPNELVFWLDRVFSPNAQDPSTYRQSFRGAPTLFALINTFPEITRKISKERWVLLVEALVHTGAVPRVSQSTVTTYWNRGLRLSN